MNNYIKSAIGLFLSTSILVSCSNFDDINTNPNTSTKVTSGMLATGMLISITQQNQEYVSFIDHNFMSKHALTAELLRDAQYNKITTGSFGAYSNLRNASKMVENASGNTRSGYEGLALFLKAYQLFYLSLDCGDIPYKESLKGESEGLTQPKYDSQKEVMQQVLNDLEQAEVLFATSPNFEGDPIMGGDTKKWQKITNAFSLKVLVNLYLHDTDANLKVKERFSKLISKKAIMESNSDNFQLVYSNKGGQIYPFNDVKARSNNYCALSSNLVDSLRTLNDNRLFYFAEPSAYMINQGKAENDFDAYQSIDPSLPFDSINKLHGVKKYCGLNKRYTALSNPAGEPIIRIGYAEQCFNIAEGIARGWALADAKAYYEAGIKAAMSFVKNNTPDEFIQNRPTISSEYINNYLNNPKISFSNNPETQLKQIFQQKYFTYFLQNPWDGFYENRRTSYPILPVDPKTNMNQLSTQLPKRWTYPQNEYNENSVHIKEALERQFGGRDDNNDLMWILKK